MGLKTTAAGIAAVLLLAPAAASAKSAPCDRACLRQTLDAYLAAVVRHDPASAPTGWPGGN